MNFLTDYVFDIMLAVIRTSGYALVVALVAEILVLILNALRVPKRVGFVLLWVVLLRMLVPVSLPSQFSIFNLAPVRDVAAYCYDIPANGGYVGDYEIAVEGTNTYDEAIYAGLQPNMEKGFPFQYVYYTEDDQGNLQQAVTYRETYGAITALIWMMSIFLFWGYGILSALLLKRRVATATILEPGVYETDQINAPFILGVFHPKIYLPVGLDTQQREMILCHERMHLRWGDHLVKIIAYFAAGLHWYNIWLGLYFYRVFLEQMEEACDQDVLRKLGAERKADYSEALLSFSTKRQFRQVVTVAFGESWIKERIKLVLKYKKPWRWLTVPAMVVVLAALVSLGTDSITQGGTLIETHLLTTEEMAQTGLPGSVIRFDMTCAEEVGSAAFDLEVWSSNGMVQRERVRALNGSQLLDLSKKFPVEWAFDLKSEKTLQGFTSMDWSLHVAGELSQGCFEVAESDDPYHGMSTGFIGQDGDNSRYVVETNDNVVLFCGLFQNDGPNGSQIGCAEISRLNTIPLEDGQLAVVLRMYLYNSARPFAITMHDLLPASFSAEPMMEIAAEGKSATISGEAAKELRQLLSEIAFTCNFPQGKSKVANEGFPLLRLYGKNEEAFEITVSGHYLLIYDAVNGTLERALGDHLSCRRLAARIYRELGLNKTAQEVYQMPTVVGKSAYGWALTASVSRKDIWLYTNEETTDSLLISGLYSEPVAFYSGDNPNSLDCQDFSGDGREEIVVFCNGDSGQRLYVLTPGTEAWCIDLVGQSDLNYWMDSVYGEYADNSDLAEIVMESDFLASLQFSKEEVLGAWAGGKYIHDLTEDHYQNAQFYEQDHRLMVTATRVLHMQKDGQDAYIPCAQVTAEICYLGPSVSQDPFQFCNFSLRPLR